MIHKNNTPISDLDTWFRVAGPKSASQWKDHRSAKECARYWLTHAPALPAPIREILERHPDVREIKAWVAEPEAPVRFDAARGEPANIDVLIRAEDANGPLVIAVEAKADESFGATLADQQTRAEAALTRNPRSGALARLDHLVSEILGLPAVTPAVQGLRYQLLTATAAALAEAERTGASRAIVLVHEFVTDATRDDRHAANARDLDDFCNRVFGQPQAGAEHLLGSARVPGTSPAGARLYLSKLTTRLREP